MDGGHGLLTWGKGGRVFFWAGRGIILHKEHHIHRFCMTGRTDGTGSSAFCILDHLALEEEAGPPISGRFLHATYIWSSRQSGLVGHLDIP